MSFHLPFLFDVSLSRANPCQSFIQVQGNWFNRLFRQGRHPTKAAMDSFSPMERPIVASPHEVLKRAVWRYGYQARTNNFKLNTYNMPVENSWDRLVGTSLDKPWIYTNWNDLFLWQIAFFIAFSCIFHAKIRQVSYLAFNTLDSWRVCILGNCPGLCYARLRKASSQADQRRSGANVEQPWLNYTMWNDEHEHEYEEMPRPF